MSMSEQARALLAAQLAPARITELMACQERLDEVRSRLARAEQRVSWWDRAVFFHTTADEAKVKAVREERAEAETAHEQARTAWRAVMQACSSYAPIEIVFRIESILFDVLADREVGREARAGKGPVEALEAVAARVAEIWAPGVDLVEVAARVPDDAARQQAKAHPPGPLARHPELGWAPMDGSEVFLRVAHALETSAEFASARQLLAREQQEDASFSAALEQARAQVTFADKLAPWQRDREKEVARLEVEVKREEEETKLAIDWIRLAVARAFAAHPVTWLYFALLGAAVAIRSARPSTELVVDGSGDADDVESGSARSVILACLVEVRRACERAFPGVPSQIWPRGRQQVAVGPVADGPYRLQAAVADAPEPVEAKAAEQAFFAHVDAGQVRSHLVNAVTVATIMGFVSSHSDRTEVAWLDRLAFWSDTPEQEQKQQLDARLEAHRNNLAYHGEQALTAVGAIALEEHPLVGLGYALPHAVRATEAIHTSGGRSSSPRHCPTINKGNAQSWLSRLDATLVRFFAVQGDRGGWVNDICRRIGQTRVPLQPPAQERITAYADVVEVMAAKLAPTDFVSLAHHVWQRRDELFKATHEASVAGGRVSFWDRVNVFSDTEDEKLRDAWNQHAKEIRGDLAGSEAEMNRLLEDAMTAHPPLRLYEQLSSVQRAVAAIHAKSERRTVTHTQRNSKGEVVSTRTETYYVCVIYGQSEAENAIERWAERVVDIFGPLPTPSDALEAWIAREL